MCSDVLQTYFRGAYSLTLSFVHLPALASLFCHSLWMISMFLPRVVSAAIMLWCPFWIADVTSRSDSSEDWM